MVQNAKHLQAATKPLSDTLVPPRAAAAILSIAMLSLWLRSAFPVWGIWAPHDDLLFVRLAAKMGAGEWLGAYGQMTHVKGIFYPLFIGISHLAGLPLKLCEHFVYLLASLAAAISISQLTRYRWLLVPSFTVLALNPAAWMSEYARIIRESIYQSLGLTIFALVTLMACKRGQGKAGSGVLGCIAGGYWLTREEGAWLAPSLALVFAAIVIQHYREQQNPRLAPRLVAAARKSTLPLLPALLTFGISVIAVNAINYFTYGVFRNNDFRSGPFVEAYGALARISHDNWKRYVVFPKDARERAYAVSPAAQELRRSFDGPDKSWVTVSYNYPAPWGCRRTPETCSDEILSGWFMWALRDAVEAAGHYGSARDADSYYRRLADEINSACDTGAIPCTARRATMLPVWRQHYWLDSWRASGAILNTLARYFDRQNGAPRSELTPEQRAIIEYAVNGSVTEGSPTSDSPNTDKRLYLAQTVTEIYAKAIPLLFHAALFGYAALLALFITGRLSPAITGTVLAITGAMLAAVATRVFLLGLLEATSIPSNNPLYLSPAVPFYLLFSITGLALCGQALADHLSALRRGR